MVSCLKRFRSKYLQPQQLLRLLVLALTTICVYSLLLLLKQLRDNANDLPDAAIIRTYRPLSAARFRFHCKGSTSVSANVVNDADDDESHARLRAAKLQNTDEQKKHEKLRFQPVFDPSNATQLMVYSAWHDKRVFGVVHVVTIARAGPLPRRKDFICVFVNRGADAEEASTVEFLALSPTHTPLLDVSIFHPEHTGTLLLACKSPRKRLRGHWWVSIARKGHHTYPQNALPVQLIDIPCNRKLFAVCVQPLHSNFSNSQQLVEMIELNRILGAQRFYFYNHSITSEVNKVLHYYTTQTDYVQVLPWHFDATLGVAIAGQMSALADCQRRVMQRFMYLIHTDLDDFIILRTQKNWFDFFNSTMSREAPAHYVFGNVYFLRANTTNNEKAIAEYNIQTLMATMRFVHTLPYTERTKLIALAECVGMHQIHNILAPVATQSCTSVPSVEVHTNVGFLHHFRSVPAQLPNKTHLVQDNYVINTFKNELLAAVLQTHHLIQKTRIA